MTKLHFNHKTIEVSDNGDGTYTAEMLYNPYGFSLVDQSLTFAAKNEEQAAYMTLRMFKRFFTKLRQKCEKIYDSMGYMDYYNQEFQDTLAMAQAKLDDLRRSPTKVDRLAGKTLMYMELGPVEPNERAYLDVLPVGTQAHELVLPIPTNKPDFKLCFRATPVRYKLMMKTSRRMVRETVKFKNDGEYYTEMDETRDTLLRLMEDLKADLQAFDELYDVV